MSTLSSRHDTAGWQAIDRRHFLHPFTDTKALREVGTRVIVRADGVWLWDSNGEKLLDGMAGLWCVNIGYGRHELAEVAAAQMRELPYYNNFFKTANPPVLALSELLAAVTPAHMNHVMFTGSGSEANDTILRFVRRYWDVRGEPRRKTIISRWQAYHGSTVAGASLGGMTAMHAQGDLPIPGIVHIDPPYWYQLGGASSPADFGLAAAGWLEQKILELGPETVAAFIGEPIQGAGGVIIPPDSYWPEIERICRKYGILLVADEVICGFGRTGRWFGCETFGFAPDLMAMAKGMSSGYLPIGGVMVADAVAEVMIEGGGEFFHGYTYSGHPTCCAVAERNIRILRDEGIVDRVREDTGPYLQRRWRELADHPLVGEVRGIGFIGALELVKDKATRERYAPLGEVGTLCRDFCFANGLVMRAVWDTMIISPPLVMSHAEIDELVTRARHCLDLTARALGVM
ncbi:MAG TPA: aspartate aminotransferase family protein [Gammaproteobacteria bacterium]|nr:aspartate aminotransferase family protein [Gammaproteobacteria bacterium]